MAERPTAVPLEVADLLASVAVVSQNLLSQPDVERTVQQALTLAIARPGGDETWASICLVDTHARVVTTACSDERAGRSDQMQHDTNEGPCLEAVARPDLVDVYVEDVGNDSRYRIWGPQAHADVGVGSALAIRLAAGEVTLGALNLSSPYPDGFDERTRSEGRAFAAQLAAAVHARRLEQHLRAGMETRTVIGQAIGILMERHTIDAGRAFSVLTRTSQETNVKLAELARQLADTGRLPGFPARRQAARSQE